MASICVNFKSGGKLSQSFVATSAGTYRQNRQNIAHFSLENKTKLGEVAIADADRYIDLGERMLQKVVF